MMMWHLTIVETVYGQKVFFASLVIQLSQVCNQTCYPKNAKAKYEKWKASLALMLETCTQCKTFIILIILHIGTNDGLNRPPNEILG